MERVETLIDKLKDQLVQNAGRDKLLVTVQLLLAELQQPQIKPAVKGKISVIMPLYMSMKAASSEIMQATQPETPTEPIPIKPPEKEPANPPAPEQVPGTPPEKVPQHYPDGLPGRPPEQVPEYQPEETPERPPEQIPENNPRRVPEEFPERVPEQFPEETPEQYPEQVPELFPEQVPSTFPEQGPGIYAQHRTEHLYAPQPAKPVQKEDSIGWIFNTAVKAPTLEQQGDKKEVYELNDIMIGGEESLNDRLKEEKLEVAAALHSASVKDLKRAIGINDRYLFINELFRGDENMYERSLKTINGFSIFPEAQYWIQRELNVKLGWDDKSEAVRLFNQLVIRRFS